jgi:hypothetical protein
MDWMFGAPLARATAPPPPPSITPSLAVPPADFGLGPLSGGSVSGGARRPPKMGLDALGFGAAGGSSSAAGAPRPAGDAWAVDVVPQAPRAPLPVPKQAPTLDEVRATQAADAAAFAAAPYRSSGGYGVAPRSGGASASKRRVPRAAAPSVARRRAAPRAPGAAGADDDDVLDDVQEVSEDEGEDEYEEVDEDCGPPLELPLPTWPPGTRPLPLQPGARALSIPPNIANTLMDFQKDGVRFLHRRWCLARGCILGDDMVRVVFAGALSSGLCACARRFLVSLSDARVSAPVAALQGLGKTLQTIALLAALFDKRGVHNDAAGTFPDGRRRPRPPRTPHAALIVVPKSVLLNWERELDAWGTFARVTAYAKKDQDAALDAVRDGAVELCLTTYGIYQRRTKDFAALPWAVVVFDEAHALQNQHTEAHRCAALAPACAFRILLTGTVMSNNFMELYTILSLVGAADDLGSSKDFQKDYARPISLGRRVNATQLEQARYGQCCRAMQRVVRTHMLSRQKKDPGIKPQLKGLRRKTDNIVFCELSPLQQAAYERMQRSPDFELLWRYDELCDCGSGAIRGKCCHRECDGDLFQAVNHENCDFINTETGEPDQKCPRCCILPFLLLSQKLGNHLELAKVDPSQTDEEKVKRDTLVARAVLGPDADELGGLFITDQWAALADERHCGKLRALKALLALWRKNPRDKVLLFSYSTRLLTILEHFLLQEGHTFSRLDGKTPTKQRKLLVDQFNHPASTTFIFLISTRAGGVGLNLTGANRVVIFDPKCARCAAAAPAALLLPRLLGLARHADLPARRCRTTQLEPCARPAGAGPRVPAGPGARRDGVSADCGAHDRGASLSAPSGQAAQRVRGRARRGGAAPVHGRAGRPRAGWRAAGVAQPVCASRRRAARREGGQARGGGGGGVSGGAMERG